MFGANICSFFFLNLFILLLALIAGKIITNAKNKISILSLFLLLFFAFGLFFSHYNIRPRTENPVYSLSRIVYWTPNGYSYHLSESCHALYHSDVVISGTLQEALDEEKTDPCNYCAGGT